MKKIFICFSYAFHMLSYAFHMLSYAFHTLSYAFIRFCMLIHGIDALLWCFVGCWCINCHHHNKKLTASLVLTGFYLRKPVKSISCRNPVIPLKRASTGRHPNLWKVNRSRRAREAKWSHFVDDKPKTFLYNCTSYISSTWDRVEGFET